MALRRSLCSGTPIASSSRLFPTGVQSAVIRAGRRSYASVPDPGDETATHPSGQTQKSKFDQHASAHQRRAAVEQEKERKFKQYEVMLKAKAAEEGVDSIEALAAKRKAERDASLSASLGLRSGSTTGESPSHPVEQRDQDLAAKIRAAAEAETKRKLAAGELSSSPDGSKSPIKPLKDIIDLSKLEADTEMTSDKIKEMWTAYHTMKGKLSAVIPTEVYERLIASARQYSQFVLPLPRTIVGGDDPEGDVQAENLAPGEKKQGYEMQFMEWGFMPPVVANVPTPTTVLFTPLAEYKLRQEFAQPLLVLTHYTDLAKSKGVVLMRGELTSSEEIEANPSGIAAAEAAKSRGATEEEQERLKTTPVQATTTASQASQGKGAKLSESDAQLLAMTMQRFYLPNTVADDHAQEREQLLKSFHEDKDAFNVQRLCEVAFTF